jgi:TonB family protein
MLKVLSVAIHSTLPAYEHDLDRLEGTEAGVASWRFDPARRAGKPVNSLIHFSVVFNPASAGVAGPDATPRLLDARPVVDPKRKSGEFEAAVTQEVIWAMVSVDEQGHPTAVKGAPDAVAGLLEQGVKARRFAPARHAGRAVGQDVRVPFIIIAANNGLARNKTPPRVIRQSPPAYPFSMRQSRMRGEVLVQFIVDIEGPVKRPFVVRSLNPAFDAPALESVRSWVFEPGRENGVPVYTQMQVPIFFALNGVDDGGSDGINVTWGGDRSKLPSELQVDVQPKIRSLVMPVYPYELLRGDVTGSAEVAYVVDDQGRVASSRVVKADRPEFGLALQAAVERFEYEPAIKNGRPNKALLAFEQDFLSSSHNIVTGDQGPDWRIEVALVELLIDEEGNPRLSRVVSASEPAFGYSAAEAAALWRFSPPTSKGKAVVTRVRVPFVFDFANPAPENGNPQPT